MSKKKGGLLKFAAGLGLGVGLGMLFAPKKGEELRKDLKVKFDELLNKVKEIDVKEVAKEFMDKINNLKDEIEDLDKEKVLEIAKKKGEQLKEKAAELVELAKEKGTPVLEKTAEEVREKAILVTKEVLKKLEKKEAK
ncbi:MAG: YtxH domain-containing protein [Bacilli bacterium]|nr:YtxH domain-containing protein [Bacilli bacterium]